MPNGRVHGRCRIGRRDSRKVVGVRSARSKTRSLNLVPRLSIGLPVYNGEKFLSEAIESLLGQSYQDFELIVSDNASTDNTAEICRRYAEQDSRVRYVRQAHNIGLVANHDFVVEEARGELFKCAAYDDLYGRELLARCVEALDADPDAVLAHSWSTMIDESGNVLGTYGRGVAMDSARASVRFHNILSGVCHDYEYGVMRTATLRRTMKRGSFHNADRLFNAELALHGRFQLVPDWLYFRREHAGNIPQTARDRCTTFDPRRANRWRHPAVRLYGEYLWAIVKAIKTAPLQPKDQLECYSQLAHWMVSRALPVAGRGFRREPLFEDPLWAAPFIQIDAIVPGRDQKSARSS
jgi:glycosyltransferase involved in cell wall biosynthesis